VSDRAPAAARPAPLRRLAELTVTAGNAARLLAGARMTDGQVLPTLSADAAEALRDARGSVQLPPGWVLGDRLTTVADVAVIEVREGSDLAAVLKLARTPAGNADLSLQRDTMRSLAGDPGLGGWRRLVPEVLAQGLVGGHEYTIERAVPGTVGTALADGVSPALVASDAVRAIAELHRATGRAATASRDVVDSWLEPALSLVAEVPMLVGPARRHDLVERLRDRIRSGVEGRTVWLGRTHGDYVPGNLFADRSGATTGIVDWGQSRAADLAAIDPMTLLLVDRARRDGTELGRVVRDLCRGVPLTDDEETLLAVHRAACPADAIDVDVLALLTWVRHVENNLLKSPRYRANPVWVYLNLETVLRTASSRRARRRLRR